MEKRKAVFPKGFFTKERPKVNLKDALKDLVPVLWISNVSTPNDKKKPSNKTSIIADIK